METVELKVNYVSAGLDDPHYQPTLSCFVPKYYDEMGRRNRGAVLICPGGGNDYCSEREADPVALRFSGAGYAAFVLRYSCVDKKFMTALLECAAAVKYIRENAQEFDINPDKIFVMGFSAGGHLAACMANLWNSQTLADVLGCQSEMLKVNGSVLGYSVILSDPKLTHEGTIANLLEHKENNELREFLSMDKRIGKQTPPTFLWHCADDGCVPVENSLYYMAQLSANHIPFEAHIFPSGGHGLALCDETTATWEGHIQPRAAAWSELCIKWMNDEMKK
ncbi:MAG: alpha/beta hydrolase [Ruminococcus sp.]|nr:alpha/beta hydrolase [Ruminococcus sp.]